MQRPDALRKGPLAMAAHVLLGIDLALVAYSLVATIVQTWRAIQVGATPGVGELTLRNLLLAQAITFVMFGVIPLAWVAATRVRPGVGTVLYLGLTKPIWAFLRGLVLFLGILGILMVFGLIIDAFGYKPKNPVVDALAPLITWRVALFLSLTAGIGEEILFRGVLQPWLGVWGQAVLFGLAHVGYGTPLQVIIPFLMGLGFGFLRKRGESLITMMTAHTLYDLVSFYSLAGG